MCTFNIKKWGDYIDCILQWGSAVIWDKLLHLDNINTKTQMNLRQSITKYVYIF